MSNFFLERESDLLFPKLCLTLLLTVQQSLILHFKRLLSIPSWPIRAYTMSSFLRFSHSLHPSHQGVLTAALPSEQTELFKCRMRRLVLRGSGGCTVSTPPLPQPLAVNESRDILTSKPFHFAAFR